MTEQSMVERILKLLPHWAEHEEGHVAELRQWRERAAGELDANVVELLAAAEEKMLAACDAMRSAYALLNERRSLR